MRSFSRRPSSGSSTTHTARVGKDHQAAGGTTDGSGALYPHTAIQAYQETGQAPAALDDMSPGVKRIEVIGQFFNGYHKWVLFFFIFLVSCKSPLDQLWAC